ncbi:ion channel [Vibrio cyclitrophicus]
MQVSHKIFTVALSTTFVSVAFRHWEVGLVTLALAVPYYVYWALNHDICKHRLEAFAIFILLMSFTISTFSVIYEMEGILCNGALVNNTYESFYFSIVTWTTLGYGDCLPTENIRHIAALEALFGYIMMAIFMSLFLAVFNSRTAVVDKDA